MGHPAYGADLYILFSVLLLIHRRARSGISAVFDGETYKSWTVRWAVAVGLHGLTGAKSDANIYQQIAAVYIIRAASEKSEDERAKWIQLSVDYSHKSVERSNHDPYYLYQAGGIYELAAQLGGAEGRCSGLRSAKEAFGRGLSLMNGETLGPKNLPSEPFRKELRKHIAEVSTKLAEAHCA